VRAVSRGFALIELLVVIAAQWYFDHRAEVCQAHGISAK
jgi:hypothetical protein